MPIGDVLNRNIEALRKFREQHRKERSRQDRIADAITSFTGSMAFVYLHIAFFGGWLLLNSGIVPAIKPWDPFPYVMLAMEASVEAIFLSTFVLISQNRMAELDASRDDLSLQVTLLTEHELTRLTYLLEEIAKQVGVQPHEKVPDLEEIKKDIPPRAVLRKIEESGRGK